MNREQWKFAYTANKILAGAEGKASHHRQRMRWWSTKRDEVIAKVKAEGIEIDESLANVISNSYSRQPSVQIRNDLVKDLQECVTKIAEHRQKAEGYEAWVQVLTSQGSTSFELNHDDWIYFFGS